MLPLSRSLQSLKHTLPNWPQMENTLLKLNVFFFFFFLSVALHGLLKGEKKKFEQNAFDSGSVIPPACHIFGFFPFGSGFFLI